MKSLVKIILILSVLLPNMVFAQQGDVEEYLEEEAFNPGETIMHHVGDAHEWHLATIDHTHIALPLPIIVYSNTRGVVAFMSSKFHNESQTYNGYRLDEHDHIVSLQEGEKIYDFSITKNVASLILSVIILLAVFISIANRYKRNAQVAPSGMQSFFEPIILYIRDDIAKSMIGPKYERYMPYLLTVFFFIWFNNLLGLLPGAANVTGNLAVTFVLAVITFLITNFSGNKYYWGHVFNPPVPLPMKFLMVPIEIVSLFTKPFSLMVRLFANITAGHIIILSLLSLIFIFKSVFASLISLPFAIFMMTLELFVALLQAYIFTLLSAMYFSAAVEEHHHDDHSVEKALY